MSDWYPGIRAFCAHWQHAPMLQQTFETLERDFDEGNDACIDAAKGLVECACRLLNEELADPVSPLPPLAADAALSDLVGRATRLLDLGSTRHRAFANLIREHNRLTEALRVLRNEAGPVSHGKDGFIAKLSVHHRRGALLAADAIITFLHEAYLEREPDPVRTFEPYERFAASNDQIDRYSSVRVDSDEEGLPVAFVSLPNGDEIPIPLEASRLLFGIDREAYKVARNACREVQLAAPVEEEVA